MFDYVVLKLSKVIGREAAQRFFGTSIEDTLEGTF